MRNPFPNLRTLVLAGVNNLDVLGDLISSSPSLKRLEIKPFDQHLLKAVCRSVSTTLEVLSLTGAGSQVGILEYLRPALELPNLAGLRRLNLPTFTKPGLGSQAGIALLEECEARSVSLLCRYGYM